MQPTPTNRYCPGCDRRHYGNTCSYRIAHPKERQKMTKVQVATANLLDHFGDALEAAKAQDEPEHMKRISLRSAHDSEWYTLFAFLTAPTLRDSGLLDGDMVAARLDEMRAALRDGVAAHLRTAATG